MEKKRKLRVAVESVRMFDQGLGAIENLIDRVAECKPDIMVLTEALYTRCCGVPWEPIPGIYSEAMAKKCRQHHCYIVFNLFELCPDGKVRNCNVLMDRNGSMAGKYHKIKIPPGEEFVTPGMEYSVFDTEFGKVGMAICYDLDSRFGGEVPRKLAENGAELIVCSSLGDLWQEAQQAARDYGIFVAIAGEDKYRLEPEIEEPIASVFDPDGRLLTGCQDRTSPWYPHLGINPQYEEGDGSYCYADIDLDQVSSNRLLKNKG